MLGCYLIAERFDRIEMLILVRQDFEQKKLDAENRIRTILDRFSMNVYARATLQ